MAIIDSFLQGLLQQSTSALVVFVPVLLLSWCKPFRNARLQAVLWSLVFIRLVMPPVMMPNIERFDLAAHLAEPLPVTELQEVTGPALIEEINPVSSLPTTSQVCFTLWLLWVTILLTRWFNRRQQYSRLVARATQVNDPRTLRLIHTWRMAYGLKRSVRVVSSEATTGPFTLGTMRPIVFLPTDTLKCDETTLAAVLAHELAHIKAFDDLKISCQRLLSILFFFHPAVWLAARKLDYFRELNRDQDAVSKGLLDFRAYGKGILRAVRTETNNPVGMAALSGNLHKRIEALVQTNAGKAPGPWRRWSILTLILLPVMSTGTTPTRLTNQEDAKDIVWRTPLPGGRLTSGFGMRPNPFTNKTKHHRGIDLAADSGTPIFAPADGRVILATAEPEKADWGTVVHLEHSGGFRSFFAHLKDFKVQEGQRAKAGQMIATVGETGRVTGPHLHFEIHRDGAPVDPGILITNW